MPADERQMDARIEYCSRLMRLKPSSVGAMASMKLLTSRYLGCQQ